MDFEQLLKPCYDQYVRFTRSLAGSKMDGDDLLQEALARAWLAFPRLKDEDKFKPWLLKIISNTHRSLARRWWIKRIVGLDNALEMADESEMPFDEKEIIRLALHDVPRNQREALVLFEVMGMSVAEVAEHQKVSLSAVKSRLARGRASLKKRYEALNKVEAYHEAEAIQSG